MCSSVNLRQLLVGHAAALRLALEQSQLGRSAASSGYHAYLRNGIFGAELQGMAVEQQDKLESLVMDLEQIATNGFSRGNRQRPASVGITPPPHWRRWHAFGLMQCLRATGVWCSGGDILSALDQDSALKRLREVAGRPPFWPEFIRTQLLENAHRLHYSTSPNIDWAEEEQRAEQALIAEKLAPLGEQDRSALAPSIKNSNADSKQKTIPAACRKSTWPISPPNGALSMAIG